MSCSGSAGLGSSGSAGLGCSGSAGLGCSGSAGLGCSGSAGLGCSGSAGLGCRGSGCRSSGHANADCARAGLLARLALGGEARKALSTNGFQEGGRPEIA